MKNNTKQSDNLLILLIALLLIGGTTGDRDALTQAMEMLGMLPTPASSVPVAEEVSAYVYGLRGLADYLGVSAPTAQKLINSGILEPATRRVGRKYSFNKNKVDELIVESNNNKRSNK